ncbi:MAG: hypothetical protein NUW08_04220 [Candidatus Uhrbacteria bacterium]|nr:hypothetical protein [Candidatus Uhrbacteria bacterium]
MRIRDSGLHSKLYKFGGVLWQPYTNHDTDTTFILGDPLCSSDDCRAALIDDGTSYQCELCCKKYVRELGHGKTWELAEKKWRGHQLSDAKVYSLDLPPTKVTSFAEDENYWVEAKISEKGGKRMAVVYFGEKKRAKQSMKDYSQVFVDFEDEQLRFDRNNKNPMEVMAVLCAEFQNTKTEMKTK